MNKALRIAMEFTFFAALVALPLAGVLAAGLPWADYVEFPPLTRHVQAAPFSRHAFALLAAFILAGTLPILVRILRSQRDLPAATTTPARRFPWWGRAAILFGIVAWVLAWTRFEWFAPFQSFTFSPLWFAYIVVANALTWRRTGRCLLTHRPRYLLALFAASALFWWYFEYLNRFVQNWYYVNCEGLSPLQYFVFATLPFSTVLPAVMSTEELLASFPRVTAGMTTYRPLRPACPRSLAALTLLLAATGMALLGVLPSQLFPLLWLSPLLVMTAFDVLAGRPTLFSPIRQGDWSRVVRLALAALVCGGFWEMWNFWSFAKWKYAVPFVDAFHIFEMPLLGYAGYLPFGLECALVADRIAAPGRADTTQQKGAPMTEHPPFRFLDAIARINLALIASLAIFAFVVPGILVLHHLRDKALREPGMPRLARQMHERLAPDITGWATARIASGAAGRLPIWHVPATEWPIFTCVFYLMATENLQRDWARTHPADAPGAPAVYSRPAIEAAIALVTDPVHHTWVRQHWGPDYWHTQNVFFRSLVITAITRYERLTGDRSHHDLLVDQARTLAQALDASPHGVLEDYPDECYPIDVLAAIAWLADSDSVTGLDHGAFVARARRAFDGAMLDPCGLPPFFIADYQAGRFNEPSRGTGNSWILIYAPHLWPDAARRWYRQYEEHFWQSRFLAEGFREFPKQIPGWDWGSDVDSGPIIAGFSPAANAFAVAAARVNGRFDHAWPLAAQALAASWPMPGGRLLGARALSSQAHAPYLGEAAILYFLTEQPAPGVSVETGGSVPGFAFAFVSLYFLLGALFLFAALNSFRRWRRRASTCRIPHPALQAGVWTALVAVMALCAATGHTPAALIAALLLQFFPRVGRGSA